jgi:hypothetical protein
MSEDDKGGPDRIGVELPIPLPPVHPSMATMPMVNSPASFGVSHDDVRAHQASAPDDLVAGPNERGVQTEWDATSLDSAIDWLETHAGYLRRLSYDMAEIKEKLGGDEAMAGKGAMGGFPYALELARAHGQLYGSTEGGLRRLSEDLYAAARALGTVKRNYETAEGANEMSAQEMKQAFSDAARGGGR